MKNIKYALVDSESEKLLIKKLNIKKFPSLYIFNDKGTTKEKYQSFF